MLKILMNLPNLPPKHPHKSKEIKHIAKQRFLKKNNINMGFNKNFTKFIVC